MRRYLGAIVYVTLCFTDDSPCIAVIRNSQFPGLAAVLIIIGMAPVASGAGSSDDCFASTWPPTKNST